MRRRFSRELKLTVLQELETASLTEVSRKHSLHPSTIIAWRKDYEKDPHKAFAGNGKRWKPEAESAHQKRIIGELYLEIDFLKKAYEHLKAVKEEEERLGRRSFK